MSAPQNPEVASCVYHARVMHHRLEPVGHRFTYSVFALCLDLDEIPALAKRHRLFSHNRRNVFAFYDRDHLPHPDGIKAATLAFFQKNGLSPDAIHKIRLVTFPRIFGYVFNPVSFYFASDENGRPLGSIAEVSNTFGEMKPYFVPPDPNDPDRCRLTAPKHFYVSPFSKLDVAFDFRLTPPGETLKLHVDDHAQDDDRTTFVAALTGTREALTPSTFRKLVFRYPLMTLKVISGIHWQAFRLWRKKAPYIAKSANPELQRDKFLPEELHP